MSVVTDRKLQPVHLRMVRALLKMTQAEFAIYAGEDVTRDKVRNFEHGRQTHQRTRYAMLLAIQRAGITLYNDEKPGARVTNAKLFEQAALD